MIIKHKWERLFQVVPISSFLNCFSHGVRLRLWWLAVIYLLRACAFCRFIFQPIALEFCLLQHHLPAVPSVFLADDLPGRSVLQNTVSDITCDQCFNCMEHSRLCSFHVPRNDRKDLRPFFHPIFNSTF